ncbi:MULTISPECIES: hypothetical protein [Nitrospirillum]|uniref:hypothetical protein n=1 Tax=Nitrospirillum amazonense TaxID=28077 RepID=UPI0011A362DA|nr:hypothetical protein [Nitrospirillum amazonense]MEC4589938.1 hypothetical protein [Nitrospirillum amazonense]
MRGWAMLTGLVVILSCQQAHADRPIPSGLERGDLTPQAALADWVSVTQALAGFQDKGVINRRLLNAVPSSTFSSDDYMTFQACMAQLQALKIRRIDSHAGWWPTYWVTLNTDGCGHDDEYIYILKVRRSLWGHLRVTDIERWNL